jgi:hypothetical protein
MGPNEYIKSKAIEVFEIDDHEAWIVKNPLFDVDLPLLKVGYNGYVVFKEKPVLEESYHGILTYVCVHGGITYCWHDEMGSVYGFDTGHRHSGDFPIRDINWIKEQIKSMYKGILKAASLEKDYLEHPSNDYRAKLLEPLVDMENLNFGVRLKFLSGEL